MGRLWLVGLLLAGCSSDGGWLVDAHRIVDGVQSIESDCTTEVCPHNENTDLTIFNGATYLVHRTAQSQMLGPNSSLRVYRSDDHGGSWTLLAIIPAIDGRDIRDPCFYVDATGALAIKTITRLPVNSTRDSDGTDAEILGNVGRLRTKVCTAQPPYATFDCSRELDGVRLDGPIAFPYDGREYVVAREHFIDPSDKKRTALYELTDSGSGWVLHGEFPSAGDTSYAGVVPISGGRFLVSYYTSDVSQPDEPWVRAIYEPSDIYQATIDLDQL